MQKKTVFISFISLIFMLLIIALPDVSKSGVYRGLVLSSNVIIPSLFPFMVCVLIISASEYTVKSRIINKALYSLFGHNLKLFIIFVFSLLGGYPVGASLIKQARDQGYINDKSAEIMLRYCVNAGPAFIVNIIGGALGSKQLGIVLLVSHILSAITIALLSANSLKKQRIESAYVKNDNINLTQIFSNSIAAASNNLIKICSYVIFFSALNSFFEYFSVFLSILKYIPYLTEITNAVVKSKNIYIISFLLGFSGASIWCQIFSILTKIKFNIVKFLLARVAHGAISLIYTYIAVKIFRIKISTFSNGIVFNNKIFYDNITLFLSLTIMVIVFIISIFSKNNSRKFINDVL